jgi:hypothetical protein
MRHRIVCLAVALSSSSVTACSRFHRDPVPSEPPTFASASPAAVAPSLSAKPSPAQEPAASTPRCGPVGAHALDKKYDDLEDLAVVTNERAALLSYAVSGANACDHDGCYIYHQSEALQLARGSERAERYSVPNASLGISAKDDAVPFKLGDDLFMLTQGHAGAAPMQRPEDDEPDTLYLVDKQKVVAKSAKRFSGSFAARGHGEQAIAVGAGVEWSAYRTGGIGGPASVRALRMGRGKILEGQLLAKEAIAYPDSSARFYAPAVAFDGTSAAAAYVRSESAKGAVELYVVLLDPTTGKALAPPMSIAKGALSAPTLLFDRGVLHLVYGQREGKSAPYRLRHATLRAGEASPVVSVVLETPTDSALAPSLGKVGAHFALAWMHSPNDRAGSVHLGFGATIEEAARAGTRMSEPSVKNARDPELGDPGDATVLAWAEHDGQRKVRFTWCDAATR